MPLHHDDVIPDEQGRSRIFKELSRRFWSDPDPVAIPCQLATTNVVAGVISVRLIGT
jgi:hypothetical protein